MKPSRSLAFLLLMFAFKWSAAQFDTAIHFNKYSFDEIFVKAKETNKPVMLYFHIDGCGSCIQLERGAFAQKDIYSYINNNFLVYNINTQKGEGIEINKSYEIRVNPTILFLYPSGALMDRVEGYQGMFQIYGHLKRAVDKLDLYMFAKKEYSQGNRKPDFLYKYTYILDEAGDLDSGKVVGEYLETQSNKELMTEKNIGYIYDFVFYNNVFYMGHTTTAFQLMYQNRYTFAKYFDLDQIDARLILTLYTEIQKSCSNGGKNYEEIYNLLKIYHGRRNIGMENAMEKKQVFVVHSIDTNVLRNDYSGCLILK